MSGQEDIVWSIHLHIGQDIISFLLIITNMFMVYKDLEIEGGWVHVTVISAIKVQLS